jgi:hypothetical protein
MRPPPNQPSLYVMLYVALDFPRKLEQHGFPNAPSPPVQTELTVVRYHRQLPLNPAVMRSKEIRGRITKRQ